MKWLPAAITLMGLLYIFLIPDDPLAVKLTFKIIPMLLILLFAYQRNQLGTAYEKLILAGLFFCMLGDGLLIWFLVGLSAFLIGHLFYIGSFFTKWSYSHFKAAAILPIMIYSFFIGSEIVQAIRESGDTALVIPVICYIIVISIMGWSAIMTGKPFAIAGALLFVASDSILAWNMFVSDIAYSHALIMLTYYSGQFLIAASIPSRRKHTAALHPEQTAIS